MSGSYLPTAVAVTGFMGYCACICSGVCASSNLISPILVRQRAVRYWLDKEKIPIENLLIIVDDLALPLGTIRLRMGGSDGGHNGLKDIIAALGHNKFNRLRFGIGNNFAKGRQIDFVLGKIEGEDWNVVDNKLDMCCDIIKSFATIGMDRTMNLFNGK